MTIVNKGSKIQICIDPMDLNNAIQREHFPLKIVDVIENMSKAKFFMKLGNSARRVKLKTLHVQYTIWAI